MTLLRVLILLLAVAAMPACGALAATNADVPAPSLLDTQSLPIGLKVCLVGAALGAALERLRSGGNTRRM